jgi:hypothetical protein
MAVFWDVKWCSFVDTDLHLRGAYFPHHQSDDDSDVTPLILSLILFQRVVVRVRQMNLGRMGLQEERVMRTDTIWVPSVLEISPLTRLRTIFCKLCFKVEIKLHASFCTVEKIVGGGDIQPGGSFSYGLGMRLRIPHHSKPFQCEFCLAALVVYRFFGTI